MPDPSAPIRIATRGSALALAQSNMIQAQCQAAFPQFTFELRIIKTTGDKLQTASMAKPAPDLPKGLFTKELEVALLNGEADFAVHSLKDLPTELPEGLMLGAVSVREDARDVLIYRAAGATPHRGFPAGTNVRELPQGAVVATSSTRRSAQLLALRPDLRVVEIRGNVPTRLQKIADQTELDATLLAAAGLARLHYTLAADGTLSGEKVPAGLLASRIEVSDMIPCVGQAAIGMETRVNDERIAAIMAKLNHPATFQCVTAERAFLRKMGGGCQSPIAAYAEHRNGHLYVRAVSFRDPEPRRAEGSGSPESATQLGEQLAAELL